jgi:vesicle-associated membrane protein-associated protein B
MSESTCPVLVDPLGGPLLDPANELRFQGPFADYVTVSLTIANPTDKRIAFKIKTTAPKRYCVTPNSGVLDSAQCVEVNVLLQTFQCDPNEKNKHKFMVQYLYLNDEEIQLSVNDILNVVSGTLFWV